jgi:hypothetical protein
VPTVTIVVDASVLHVMIISSFDGQALDPYEVLALGLVAGAREVVEGMAVTTKIIKDL